MWRGRSRRSSGAGRLPGCSPATSRSAAVSIEQTVASAAANNAQPGPRLPPDAGHPGREAVGVPQPRAGAGLFLRGLAGSSSEGPGAIPGPGPGPGSSGGPAGDVSDYTPDAGRGTRLPHAWLPGGSSLYDRLGARFTLLGPAGEEDPGVLALRGRARRRAPALACSGRRLATHGARGSSRPAGPARRLAGQWARGDNPHLSSGTRAVRHGPRGHDDRPPRTALRPGFRALSISGFRNWASSFPRCSRPRANTSDAWWTATRLVRGHGPINGDNVIRGKVGGDLSLEEGRHAARLTALSILASVRAELGDLDRIARIVKVFGMVDVALASARPWRSSTASPTCSWTSSARRAAIRAARSAWRNCPSASPWRSS